MVIHKCCVKITREILAITLALILSIIFPIFLLLLSPILIYRFLIFKVAPYLKPNLGKMLSATSTIMTLTSVYDKPKNSIIVPFILEGPVSIEKVREVVQQRLLNAKDSSTGQLQFPELKQNLKYWLGYLFWSPVNNFRMEDHVYLHDECVGPSAPPMTSLNGLKLISELTTKSWSRDKALWDITVVLNAEPWSKNPNKENSNKKYSLVIFRFHHGLCDGFSVLKILGAVGTEAISSLLEPRIPRSETPNRIKVIQQLLGVIVKTPYDLAHAIISPSPDSNPLSFNSNSLTGKSIGGISELIPMQDIKDVKNALGVGFTTVVIALISEGITEMLRIQGKKLPKKLALRFPVPLPGHSSKLRNEMSFASILVNLHEDRIKRVRSIQSQVDQLKKSTLPLTMLYLVKLGGSFFPKITQFMTKASLKQQCIGISNFPGPSKSAEVLGYLAESYFFTCSAAGTSVIGFAASPYLTDMQISVNADQALIRTEEDANEMLKVCRRELVYLKEYSNRYNDLHIV